MGKKRILKEFKLTEISAVDKPAQSPALAIIMKRNDSLIEKNADVLSGITEGHQHGIEVEVYDGQLYLYVGRGLTEGQTENHNHEIIFNYQTGLYELSTNAGHTHSIDTNSIQTVLVNRFSKGITANTISKEKASTLTAAGIGGSKPVHKEEIQMPEVTKAEHDTALANIISLKKSLATAVALGSLDDSQKNYHNTLSVEDQGIYLGKSADERNTLLEKALEANAIVFTAVDGTTFRKSDDPRMVTMAKRADASDAALAKAHEATEGLALEKRIATDFVNLPGELPAQKALLKAIATIEDEPIRTAVESILKAHDAGFSLITKTLGTSIVPATAGTEVGELDTLAKAHVSSNPTVSYMDAYDIVANANPELYNKAVAG